MIENLRISRSLEDCLESIYFLMSENKPIRITDLAISLNISKSSVTKTIRILREKGYVNHEHYGVLELTEEGFIVAQVIAKNHEIIKSFLINILDVDDEVANTEACIMEHVLSKDTIYKLENFMKSNMQ